MTVLKILTKHQENAKKFGKEMPNTDLVLRHFLGRVEWGKTHTFWNVGSVSQSSEDNDLIPFLSGTSNICLQNIGETVPWHERCVRKSVLPDTLQKGVLPR